MSRYRSVILGLVLSVGVAASAGSVVLDLVAPAPEKMAMPGGGYALTLPKLARVAAADASTRALLVVLPSPQGSCELRLTVQLAPKGSAGSLAVSAGMGLAKLPSARLGEVASVAPGWLQRSVYYYPLNNPALGRFVSEWYTHQVGLGLIAHLEGQRHLEAACSSSATELLFSLERRPGSDR